MKRLIPLAILAMTLSACNGGNGNGSGDSGDGGNGGGESEDANAIAPALGPGVGASMRDSLRRNSNSNRLRRATGNFCRPPLDTASFARQTVQPLPQHVANGRRSTQRRRRLRLPLSCAL